ncbi:hypothetical protein Hsw_3941 [Hymenobacter swuensis DY53]|uniref:Uncharacterized protein n=1 Tax=Hymenobacter swuensis DY53 TaxID=1227739 RepID=W8FA81_9BACT|nr:hypothetical protein Hsw_3941 [Hymenobacter swuensis DY53]
MAFGAFDHNQELNYSKGEHILAKTQGSTVFLFYWIIYGKYFAETTV